MVYSGNGNRLAGYKYIELRGSSYFVYDDSRKCGGKWPQGNGSAVLEKIALVLVDRKSVV